MIRPFIIGFATTLKHIFKKPITVNYPEQKVPVFPKYRGQAGADARRERARRSAWPAACARWPVRPTRSTSKPPRTTARCRPGPRYAKSLPDPQDALHLLRILRGGLPGVGDLHGQGLRARRLQQQGLHLGQGRPAGARRQRRSPDRAAGASTRGGHRGRSSSARSATFTAISQASAASRRGIRRSAPGCASATSPTTAGLLRAVRRAGAFHQGQQRGVRRDRRAGAAVERALPPERAARA